MILLLVKVLISTSINEDRFCQVIRNDVSSGDGIVAVNGPFIWDHVPVVDVHKTLIKMVPFQGFGNFDGFSRHLNSVLVILFFHF
jgi:hypothetical protein